MKNNNSQSNERHPFNQQTEIDVDALTKEALKSFETSTPEEISLPINIISEQIANSLPKPNFFAEAFTTSLQFCKSVNDSLKQITSPIPNIFPSLKDFVIPLQPQVYDGIQHTLEQLIPEVQLQSFAAPLSDAFNCAFGDLNKTSNFIKILEKTSWPLYFVDNDKIIEGTLAIDKNLTSDEAAVTVYSLAFEQLDSEWIKDTKERWSTLTIVSDSEKSLLTKALDYHTDKNYYGCVAILMCLFTGFAECFGKETLKCSELDREMFNLLADDFDRPHINAQPNPDKNLHEKDYILVCLSQIDSGWLIWREATSYLINIVLTNNSNDLAEHNPLRHKICHGDQTNYGTWEHSIKAILATDLLLRIYNITSMSRNASSK